MAFFSKLFSKSKRSITWEQLANAGYLGENPIRNGVVINEQTAIGLSALNMGIRIIAQDVGKLQPFLYKEVGVQREKAIDNPIYNLLLNEPNSEMTRPVFFETLMHHALLHNFCVAEIERNNAGVPIGLHPIHPGNIEIDRDEANQLVYRIKLGSSVTELTSNDVIHIPGCSSNGLGQGSSLLKIAKETLAFGINTQRHGNAFFANACRPSGVINAPGEINEIARENLRKSWQYLHSGVENNGKVAILEEGLTFTPFTQTNEQTQYVEILKYFTYLVSQLLCIPPSKINSLEKATWGNLETLQAEYLSSCLTPWLVKFEQEFEKKLLSKEDKASHYIEFDTTTLLRADIASRYAAYNVALTSGFLTKNEIRAIENYGPMIEPEVKPPEVTPPTTENE